MARAGHLFHHHLHAVLHLGGQSAQLRHHALAAAQEIPVVFEIVGAVLGLRLIQPENVYALFKIILLHLVL